MLQPAAPEASLGFNPLVCFGSPQELRRLATILCETGETSERFWTIGAVNILTLCLKVLSAIGDPRYLNLANARWLLNHIGTQSESVRRTVSRFLLRQCRVHRSRVQLRAKRTSAARSQRKDLGEAEITAAERFRYLYTEDELRSWVGPVQALAEHPSRCTC